MPAHYDFIFFVAAGVSAVVFLTLWRMLAGYVGAAMPDVGKGMGALG